MRAALDIRTLVARRTGVGNYVLGLLRGLRQVLGPEELALVARPENLAELRTAPRADMVLPAPVGHEAHPWSDLWMEYILPGRLRRRGVEVFHGPMVQAPSRGRGPATVVTIHDLVPIVNPETVPAKYAMYMRWLLKRMAASRARIIAPSQSTRYDIVDRLGVDPARVAVVHEAAHPAFRPVKDARALAEVRARYGLPGPFMLHLGNIEPRKNLVRLVRAFLEARGELGPDMSLVIAGQRAWLSGRIMQDLNLDALPPRVVFTGYLPQADLPLMMNAATAFLFPSLYEGFGLPVLEAMACGAPVLTSNVSSLPEVAGDAALLVNPGDVSDIAAGVTALATDEALRRRLRQAGLERAARFSWQRAAHETAAVYQAALEDG